MSKTLGLATTRTFPCFPQSNCIYKQQINKLHRSLFNFLPQRRRKLSTCPHVLNFLAHALSFLLPKFDICYFCTCEWKSIGISQVLYILSFETPTFQKSRPAFFKTTLSLTIHKKNNSNCYYPTLALPVTFPCSFEKPLAVNQKPGIKKGMYCMRKSIKEEEHTSN